MAQTVLGRMKAKERREGRQEGEVLATQRAVQRTILVRFPEASPDFAERVEQIGSVRVLESLHVRVILAGSLEEVERMLRAGA